VPVTQEPLTRIGQPPATPQRVHRGKRPVLIAAAAVIALTLIAGGVYLFARPKDFDLHGTLELRHAATVSAGCIGQGGYSDITGYNQVVVTDGSGKTVAIGQTTKGTSNGLACVYEFVVPNVPSGLGFYGVEVGHRGRVQYNEDQVRKGVKLSLGPN